MPKAQNKDFFNLLFQSAKKSLKEKQQKDEAVMRTIQNLGQAIVEEINSEPKEGEE